MSGGTHPEVPNIFKVVPRTLTARVHATNAFSDYFFLPTPAVRRATKAMMDSTKIPTKGGLSS
jgi:hypothetical protein